MKSIITFSISDIVIQKPLEKSLAMRLLSVYYKPIFIFSMKKAGHIQNRTANDDENENEPHPACPWRIPGSACRGY